MFCRLHIKYVSYIYAETLVHTCFVFGQNYSRGRVDLWPERTHAHTSATTTPTHSPAHITLRVVEQNNEPFRGNPSAASSSVVASSAANSSSVEAGGSAASSAPGSNRLMWVSRRWRLCNHQTRRKPQSARTTIAFWSRSSHLWLAGES